MALEVRTRGDDAGPGQRSRGDLLAPATNRREIPTHVAHAGDAIGHIKCEQRPSRRDRAVHVHVPKPWDQPLSAPVNSSGSARNDRRRGRPNRSDPRAVDKNGHVGPCRAPRDVDRRYVSDGDELKNGEGRGEHGANMRAAACRRNGAPEFASEPCRGPQRSRPKRCPMDHDRDHTTCRSTVWNVPLTRDACWVDAYGSWRSLRSRCSSSLRSSTSMNLGSRSGSPCLARRRYCPGWVYGTEAPVAPRTSSPSLRQSGSSPSTATTSRFSGRGASASTSSACIYRCRAPASSASEPGISAPKGARPTPSTFGSSPHRMLLNGGP